jgi:glycine cleavage system H protein
MGFPEDLRYTKTHEWLKVDGDVATIGITSRAVELLGDLVFLDLPETAAPLTREERFAEIESTKAVEDIYSPVSGEILEVNGVIADELDSLRESPYDNGWMIKIKMSNPEEANQLLSASDYQTHVDAEEH